MSTARLCLVPEKSEHTDGSDWCKITLLGQDWEIRIWLLYVSQKGWSSCCQALSSRIQISFVIASPQPPEIPQPVRSLHRQVGRLAGGWQRMTGALKRCGMGALLGKIGSVLIQLPGSALVGNPVGKWWFCCLYILTLDVTLGILSCISSACLLIWKFSSELGSSQVCRIMAVQGCVGKVNLWWGL